MLNALRTISLSALAVAAGCSIYDAELLSEIESRGGSAGTATRGGTGGKGGALGGGGAGGTAGVGGSGVSGGRGGDQSEGGAAPEAGAGGDGGVAGDSGGEGGRGGSAGGSAGRGGQAGAGGAGGKSGAGGTSSGGSAAGGAGSGSGGQSGGSAGSSGETCSGCARLSVPLTASTDRQHYVIDLPGSTDFSAGVITYRVRAIAGSGGEVRAYAQHGGTPDYDLTYGGLRKLNAIASWTTVTWDLGAAVTTFDKTRIARIGIEVTGASSAAFTNPTVLYLDSISVSGPSVGPWEFGTAATLSSAATRPAAGIFWLSAEPDEALEGSRLSWLGP